MNGRREEQFYCACTLLIFPGFLPTEWALLGPKRARGQFWTVLVQYFAWAELARQNLLAARRGMTSRVSSIISDIKYPEL